MLLKILASVSLD